MRLWSKIITVIKYIKNLRYVRVLKKSEFFDSEYYERQYPDVAASWMSPAMHYLLFGAEEGRNPSPWFSTEEYLILNPDVAQSGMNPLLHYIRFGKEEGRKCSNQKLSEERRKTFDPKLFIENRRINIITTKHTRFIAELLKQNLQKLNISCDIFVGEQDTFEDVPYIVISPNAFKDFPENYIPFQMEQTVSSRWLTDKYYRKLNNASIVLDYSLNNISYFHACNQIVAPSRFYYLPIDYCSNFADYSTDSEYDVLFYGDAGSCERRRVILEKLQENFNVKICSECYGDELYREIAKAKVVVNIHYYEHSLLETTRLYETLSLNSSVIVSEASEDKTEEKRLEGIVDFVPVDDIEKLLERIRYWVSNDEARERRIAENRHILETRPNAFSFYLNRLFLAQDIITFDRFYELSGDYVDLKTDKLCLSLPESTERRKSFDEDNHYGFECVPGLRHTQGWVGCALSYKFLFKKAMEKQLETLTICEDDVIFPEDYITVRQTIDAYLAERDHWDVFSGVMADVGNVHVNDWKRVEKKEFVEIDHMISTVYNIYNKSIFSTIAAWDEQNRNVLTNTIDRYLERKNLTIYTMLPFFVGHKEELNSTIWNHGTDYKAMIERSEEKLRQKVNQYVSLRLMESILEQLKQLNEGQSQN